MNQTSTAVFAGAELTYLSMLASKGELASGINVMGPVPNISIEKATEIYPYTPRICPFTMLATALDVVQDKMSLIPVTAQLLQKDVALFPLNSDRMILGNKGGKICGYLCSAPIDPSLMVVPMACCIIMNLIGSLMNLPVGGLTIGTSLIMEDPDWRSKAVRKSVPIIDSAIPVVKDAQQWMTELPICLSEGAPMGIKEPWFKRVYHPLRQVHLLAKEGNLGEAGKMSNQVVDINWRNVMTWWWMDRKGK